MEVKTVRPIRKDEMIEIYHRDKDTYKFVSLFVRAMWIIPTGEYTAIIVDTGSGITELKVTGKYVEYSEPDEISIRVDKREYEMVRLLLEARGAEVSYV